MSDIEYITNRNLSNSSGKETGNIRILKLVSEGDFQVTLKCPECDFQKNGREPWSEPFVIGMGKDQKFVVKCGKCDYSERLLKLKKQVKKDIKGKK